MRVLCASGRYVKVFNYLREINAFYLWLQTHHLSAGAISLWHALMQIDNKADWQQSFSVHISTLMAMTSLSRAQVYRAREELYMSDRINYTTFSGRKPSSYMLLPFGFTWPKAY